MEDCLGRALAHTNSHPGEDMGSLIDNGSHHGDEA